MIALMTPFTFFKYIAAAILAIYGIPILIFGTIVVVVLLVAIIIAGVIVIRAKFQQRTKRRINALRNRQ